MLDRRTWWCAGAVVAAIGAGLLTGSGVAAAETGDAGSRDTISRQTDSTASAAASDAGAPDTGASNTVRSATTTTAATQHPQPDPVSSLPDAVARPETATPTGASQSTQPDEPEVSADDLTRGAEQDFTDELLDTRLRRPESESRSSTVAAVGSQDGTELHDPAGPASEQAESTEAIPPVSIAVTDRAVVSSAAEPASVAVPAGAEPQPPAAAPAVLPPVADDPAPTPSPIEPTQLVAAMRSLAAPVANAPPASSTPRSPGPIATLVLNVLSALGWSPRAEAVAIFPALAPWYHHPTVTTAAGASLATTTTATTTTNGVTGVKVGHAVLEIPCGPQGYTAPADWYFPTQADGSVQANGVIWLQHGFLAGKAFYSALATTLAQQTNSIVVAPTLTSFPLACAGCWLGGAPMRQAAAGMFLGDRAALNISADAAGFQGTLPSRFIMAGHSMGGGFATDVAGYTVDNGAAADNLLGVVMFDGDDGTLSESLSKLDTLDIPVYQIGAQAQFWNSYGLTTNALIAARPGQFVGVELVGGSHVDSMIGDHPIIDFFAQLVTKFSPPGNTQAVYTLSTGWINDMYVGAGPANPVFGIYGRPSQPITLGSATAMVLQDSTPAPAPSSATNSSFVLEGFGFRWDARPHRINKVGAALDETQAALTLQGGSWADGSAASDSPHWQLGYASVTSPNLLFVHGETATLTLVGDPASATTRVSVPRALMPGATSYAVYLRGFDLDTDATHQDGYTVQGLGAEVGNLVIGDDDLSFDARLTIDAGAVPDRIQHLPGYRATGTVQYTVVGIVDGASSSTSVSSTSRYPAGILDPPRPHAPQAVTIAGQPGLDLGFAALTGFQFRLNPDALLFPGRYMREISVGASDFNYIPSTGQMDFTYDGYFSNSGLVSWGLVSEFDASFVLVQAAEGTIEHATASGPASGPVTVVPLG